MWHNRFTKDQRTLCLQCCRPPCTGPLCKTCPVCRDEACNGVNCKKAIQPLHPKLLPQTLEDVAGYLCGNCRQRCALCKEAKSKAEFPSSMWHNRFDKDRRCLCFDCCRPRCTSKNCKTCAVCRDPACRRYRCDTVIQPLHHKQLPQTLVEVQTYLCSECRRITCECGNQMSKTMQKKTKGKSSPNAYVCVDCQNKKMREGDKKHRASM